MYFVANAAGFALVVAPAVDKSIRISGAKLAKARSDAFLSQEEMAALLKMAKGSVARLEQTGGGMLLSNFRRLSEVLKTTPEELLARIGANGHEKAAKRRRVTFDLSADQYASLTELADRRPVGDVAREIVLRALPARKRVTDPKAVETADGGLQFQE